MILETERLDLRPLEVSDADLLFPLMSDTEVMAHWDVPEIDDPDLVRAIVAGQVEDMAAGRALYWTSPTSTAGISGPRWGSCWGAAPGVRAMVSRPCGR